jgi:hypothetical protein
MDPDPQHCFYMLIMCNCVAGANNTGGEERAAAEPAQVAQGGPRQHQRRSGQPSIPTYKERLPMPNVVI